MDSGHNAINGGNAQGVYSASGDIMISSGNGGGKKRKGLLVVAVFLMLIAVGAGVAAWVLSQPNNGEGGGDGPSTEIASLQEAYYNDDENGWSQYYSNENKRLTSLYKATEDEDLKTLLKEQLQLLAMFNFDKEDSVFGSNAIIEAYLGGSLDSKVNTVKSKLASIEIVDGYIEEYVQKMTEAINTVTDILVIYSEAGCASSTVEGLYECELPGQYGIDYNKAMNNYSAIYNTITYVLNSAASYYDGLSLGIAGSEEDGNA